MPESEVLPYELGAGVFGRIGLAIADGPVVLPVNYAVVAEALVLRTSTDGLVAREAPGQRVAFEVDHVDYARHRGWSVLVSGPAEVIDEDDIARVRRTWDPRPWAAGERPVYLRIRWDRLTGRRLGTGWTRDEELPVQRTLGWGGDRGPAEW